MKMFSSSLSCSLRQDRALVFASRSSLLISAVQDRALVLAGRSSLLISAVLLFLTLEQGKGGREKRKTMFSYQCRRKEVTV